MREVRNISVVLSAKMDRYKADMALAGRTAVDTANKIETAWDNSTTKAGKAMQAAEQYGSEMSAVGGVMAGFGAAVVGAFGLATKAAMTWESAWTGVMKTVDGSPRQLAAVEGGLRNLAKQLPATHEEIAGVAEAAGQLGVATKDVVSFTKTMIDLGESTNLTAEEASTNIAQIMNVMGTSGDEVSKFGSALVELGNNGASTEKDILNMAQRLAGAGKLVGATEADILGMANAMASVGVRAELGGGVMSRVMNRMYADVKSGGEGLTDLAQVAGVSSKDFAAAFESDPARAVAMITEGLNGVKDSGGNVIETMAQLGIKGTEETSVMLQLAGAGDLLTDSLEMGAEAWEMNTALAVEAAKRYETSESRIKMAGNSIKDTAITIGGTFAPAVAGAVEAVGGFANAVGSIPEPVLRMGAAVGAIGGAAALAGGGFLMLAPRIAETITAVNTLREKSAVLDSTLSAVGANGKTAKALKGIAGAAGAAAGAWALIEIAAASYNAISPDPAVSGIEDITAALIESAKEGDNTTASLDRVFQAKGGGALNGDISSLAEGIDDVMYKGDGFNKFMNETFLWGVGDKINSHLGLDTTKQQFAELDEAAANMANSGSAELAAESFSKVAQSFEDGGYKAEAAMEQFPMLEEQYRSIASAAGETVTQTQMFNWMMSGEVPAHVQTAIDATGQGAESIKGMGDAAKTTAESLTEMLDGLFALGMGTLDEREAMRQYEDAVRGVNESIKENGTSLDITTAKGSANQAAFDGIADAGFRAAQSMAENGASQSDVRAHLVRTREDLIAAAGQFGITGDKAEKMANEVLGIPEGVSVSSWMDDAARKEADKTKKSVDNIDKNPKIKVHFDVTEVENGIKNMPEGLLNPDRNRSKSPGSLGKYGPLFPNHDGNVLTPMAAGGFTGAEMVNPNTWRVVGDRMDVDEAYIPLDGSKRSWKIMMEAMNRMPGMIPMASGGIVSRAQNRLDDAQRGLDSVSRSKTAVTAEDRRRDAAQKRVDDARAALDKAKEAQAKRERITELRSGVTQDVRRGSIRDQVTGGLSGGYSAVDELAGLGKNEDLSRGSRSKASSMSKKFEANLRNLYGQAERLDEKLKDAKDKATELNGIKTSVVSSLLGGRDLDVGTSQTRVNGQWQSSSNLGQAASSMKMDVGAMKAFAGKLKKLAEMGIPGEIIQQIAQAGPDEGSNMADSFLDATSAERKSYIGAWNEYEKYANQAGQYVTEGFEAGGAAAADGVVKGLEGKKKNVESAIANLAKVMEATFKSVLGIHSPSRVMAELGGFTAEGLVQGMLGSVGDVQSAASALGSAAVPMSVPNAMAFEVSATPVVEDDQGLAGLAMQDMSATTLEAMAQMQLSVSEGWSSILTNTTTAQQGMLLNTQQSQLGMLTNTQVNQAGMLTNTLETNAAKLVNTRESNYGMLSNTRVQQESMRAAVALKQSETRVIVRDQQESMRQTMADKQYSMKVRNSDEFESMKQTTFTKLRDARAGSSDIMEGFKGDYSSHLGDLKRSNKSGFESMRSTSDANFAAIRRGMGAEMEGARPELGGNLNSLIRVFGLFTSSVNKAFGDVGVKLDAPKSLKYAAGGVLPGYTPGRDIYKFHNPNLGDLELSGGEGIMRPEFVRSMGGAQGIDQLNRAAIDGTLDQERFQFADGGVLPSFAFAKGGTLMDAANWWVGKGARGSRHPAFGGPVRSGHSRGSLHYQDKAVDFNYGPGGTNAIEQGFFDRHVGQFKGMFPGIRTIWRAPGHFNHLHIDTSNGADMGNFSGAGGGGFTMPHPFLDKANVSPGGDMGASYAKAAQKLYKDIYTKHAKMLPSGFSGDLGKGIMDQAGEGLVKKAKEFGKTAGSGDMSSVANGPIKQMAKEMLERMGWGDQFGDLNWLLNKESGWNPTAQNPVSSAYGMFQFLDGTWDDVGGTKTSDPKKQLELGLKYIRQRYGDVKGARAHHANNNWYEGGARAAQSGLAVVGEQGPELVDLRGSERIHNAQQTRKLLAENRTFLPSVGQQGISSEALGRAIAAEIKGGGINASDLAAAMNGIEMTFRAGEYEFTGAVESAVGKGYDSSRSKLSKSSKKIGAV